jgi:DNA-binding transcriptional LysR family regulator
VSVVNAESFTAAAEKLGIPKSSVSRSVAQLEEELGVRLLQRTTRKLSLTEAGQAFYQRAQPAMLGLEEAEAEVTATRQDPRGTIRMTAPVEMGHVLIPKLVVEFTQKYPKVHISLSLTQRIVDLVAEGFDLALRAGKLDDSTLVARKVLTTELGLYAAPSYLERRGRPKALSELARHDCVLFHARSARASWVMIGPQGEETVEVTGPVESDALFFVNATAIEGAGIALLPHELAEASVRAGNLERVLPQYAHAGGSCYLVMPSNRLIPSHVLLFRDFLLERIPSFWQELGKACNEHVGPPSSGRANGIKVRKIARANRTARV